MNEIGWLPTKNSPFGTAVEPQKTDPKQKANGDFAQVLAGTGSQAQQEARISQRSGLSTRAPASIPQSAVSPEGANGQDALASGIGAASIAQALNAQQAAYNSGSHVSDEAVAFNARPIVGPASFNHSPDEIFLAVNGGDTAQFAAARASLASSIGMQDGHIVLTQDQPGQIGRLPVSASPTTLPSSGIASPGVKDLNTTRVEPAALPQISGNSAKAEISSEAIARTGNRAASSAPVLQLSLAAAQSPAFAQLLANPAEYRLVIRGGRLNQDQREEVLREVRSALAQAGLPDLPIDLIDTGRQG